MLPVCKDPLRNISRPKKNLYDIFTSKEKKHNITSTKKNSLRNSNNKSVPTTPTTASLPKIPSKNNLKKYKDNNLTNTSQYVKGNQTFMIKNPKTFHLNAPL